MDSTEFETTLQQDGFDEVGVKTLPEKVLNQPHSHAFDARAFILDGEITLTIDGQPTTYRRGDAYDVPAGTVHQETVPPGGVEYAFGLRHTAS